MLSAHTSAVGITQEKEKRPHHSAVAVGTAIKEAAKNITAPIKILCNFFMILIFLKYIIPLILLKTQHLKEFW